MSILRLVRRFAAVALVAAGLLAWGSASGCRYNVVHAPPACPPAVHPGGYYQTYPAYQAYPQYYYYAPQGHCR